MAALDFLRDGGFKNGEIPTLDEKNNRFHYSFYAVERILLSELIFARHFFTIYDIYTPDNGNVYIVDRRMPCQVGEESLAVKHNTLIELGNT